MATFLRSRDPDDPVLGIFPERHGGVRFGLLRNF